MIAYYKNEEIANTGLQRVQSNLQKRGLTLKAIQIEIQIPFLL